MENVNKIKMQIYPPVLIKAKEVMTYLRISKPTLLKYVRMGLIKRRVFGKIKVGYYVESILRFIKERG